MSCMICQNDYFHIFLLQVYKRKNEAAKREYVKALSEYRASQASQVITSVYEGEVSFCFCE